MRPRKLTLSAWGPYRDRQEIDFEALSSNGIFLITGATGAGKTTVFDAITYALYGALSGDERDKERGSVRSDFAEANTPTFVELVMEHGGEEYRILRNPEYLRPKKRGGKTLTKEKDNAVLYYSNGRIIEGTREVNAALLELLGLDYQQFKKISMIAQGEFSRLLVAPPKEKTRIFREIFGTGIYERFTAGLGVRSRQLYARVMEQRHKLEEDIRLLTLGAEKSVWSEEIRAELSVLAEADYWNYEEVGGLLERMEAEAGAETAALKAAYAEKNKRVEQLAAHISKEEELQRRLAQLKKVSAEKAMLEQQAADRKMEEGVLQRAVNAGFVESTEQLYQQRREQLAAAGESVKAVCREQELLLKEAEELSGLREKAERLRELLEQSKRLQELSEDRRKLEQELLQKTDELHQEQKGYLLQEELCKSLKLEYEEADRRQKLSAIGLAAALLEEGKPCPVCGSLSHPAPAVTEEHMLSEKVLQELRNKLEKAQQELQSLHEQAVTRKTQHDSLQQELQKLVTECSRLKEMLADEQDELCRRYLLLPPDKALAEVNAGCQRAETIEELSKEKERQKKGLLSAREALEEQVQASETQYRELLNQFGFSDETDYRRARLSQKERESLQRGLEDYRSRVAANRELYEHLRSAVKKQASSDMETLRRELTDARGQREDVLKQLKSWEHARAEVKKTKGLLRDKLQGMEEASAEYGYVKDLENMAAGNNPKRLVFEQYVLASYFEEILRAANLRFRRMTDGRYEMSRVSQVGDGRVKDYLEIQVMDYYTGKYRSVRTLSGGESFKASLSLALGMSDVIQSMNGGIRVDALFVDEGFGALDEESLDQACNTLMSLVERDCMIGIISHVRELGERITKQLVIEKTNAGSRIKEV